jgi:nucleotide-binding universal stress UspA family protein
MAFQHILVPIDGSETAYAAVDQAVQLAKTFNGKIRYPLSIHLRLGSDVRG